MLRKIAGLVIGVFIAGLIVAIVEGGGHALFPPPPGINVTDPADLAQIMHLIPMPAKLSVLLAWFLGALGGGWTARRISRWGAAPWIVALAMAGGAAYSLITIPHPWWMAIAGLALPFLAAFLLVRAGRG